VPTHVARADPKLERMRGAGSFRTLGDRQERHELAQLSIVECGFQSGAVAGRIDFGEQFPMPGGGLAQTSSVGLSTQVIEDFPRRGNSFAGLFSLWLCPS